VSEAGSTCPVHGVPATGVCARCGRFGCAACLATGELRWCSECLARPEARLESSPRAKRALVFALLGFHGLVPLLPAALWLARRERTAIELHQAPPAGRPLVQGARAISLVGLAVWLVLAWAALVGR